MSIGSGTGKAAGTSTITGTYSGHTGTLAITVLDGSAITASPSSLSLTAGGTPIPFTVTCTKPDNSTDASPTYTATSSNTGIATVSKSGTTVTVTGVAAGSCTITLSYTTATTTATGSVGIAVTAGAGTVTSVTVSPASSLVFASDTPVLTAKDQSGNVLDGTVGAWSSSDATNAPINSSTGAITPSASKMVGVTFTYTHTASGHTGTATATVLPSFTVIKEDKPWANYTTIADLKAATRNNVATTTGATWGTGAGAGKRYTDGFHGDLVWLDFSPEAALGAHSPVLAFEYPASDAAVGANSYGILRAAFNDANNMTTNRVWFMEVFRFAAAGEVKTSPANGTITASSYNPTTGAVSPPLGPPAAGTKNGPFITYLNYNGRTGVGYLGALTQAGCQVWNTMDTAVAGELTTNPGTEVQLGTVAADELTGAYYAYIGCAEHKSGNIMSSRFWRVKIGGGATQMGTRFEGYMAEGKGLPLFSVLSLVENQNQAHSPGQYFVKNTGYWCSINGDTSLDPFGLLGTQPTPGLTSISVNTLARGATSQTIIFNDTAGGYNENCNPIFSNPGVRVLTLTYNSATQITATVSVTSTAATGAGTVVMHNNASGTDSSTVAFTVT
jgi:hypothetical protein